MRLTRWFYTIPLRLRSLFRRPQVEQELDEELHYHLERQIEELIADGLTPTEARYAALRALGGIERRKEECRDMRHLNYLENLFQDLRYASRVLRRSPGFTMVAILSLALGIGANAAIFQLLNAVRLRSLPVDNPQELVEVRIAGGKPEWGWHAGPYSQITTPLCEQIREHQEAFTNISAWGDEPFDVGQRTEMRRINGLWVSGDLFSVLGLVPVKGRLFKASDDRPGCGEEGAVISYTFWQNYFGGEDSVIGRTLIIEDQPHTVIGVTPPGFFGLVVGKSFDVALPICERKEAPAMRNYWWLVVMGRLKRDWTSAKASEYLNMISPGILEATVPTDYAGSIQDAYRKSRLTVLPAGQGVSPLRGSYETSIWSLLVITGIVLLIACANLANLLLARASAREREIAVRVALGASRGRLIRQMLSESLLLAGSGAALGAGLAQLISRGIISSLSTEENILRLDLSSDWRVLIFMASVAILTALVFGLVPALRASQIEPVAAMRSSGRGLTNRERFSFQGFFVIGQIALSLALLVGALLFVRSFRNLITLDAGFRRNGILFVVVDFHPLHLPREKVVAFQTNLLEQIRAIPQVESAATTIYRPLTSDFFDMSLCVKVPGLQRELEGCSNFAYVGPEYLKTMEIPLLAGRDFNDFDTAASRPVALVNETFVRRFITSGNPVGTLVRTVAAGPDYPETFYEVIGVVKDTKYVNLREAIPPITYVPAAQFPGLGPWTQIVVRSSAPLTEVINEVRRKIGDVRPEITIRFKALETQIREELIRERLMAWLAGFFGILAAVLAMIGLYGVISYMVLKRRNEIGIRMALGASRTDIVWLILRETTALLLAGLGLGTAVSLAAAKSVSSLLFGLSPHDTSTLLASACLLAAVAGLASFRPALRASRIDPMEALRHD
jgi:putative ABC transport system permease protein